MYFLRGAGREDDPRVCVKGSRVTGGHTGSYIA